MFIAKKEIIKQFLAFVTSFTPFEGMRLATLGGEGLEAAIWQEIGIPSDNGWLIECVQKRSRRLMARFPYRHCTRLAHFSKSAESVWGKTYGIDGFHLDLCGTYETGNAAFKSVVPLIMRSVGKCLAVTVADQRRNPSLDHFDEVFSDAGVAFGGEARAQAFLEQLTIDYEALPTFGVGLHADPRNGAERELGFAYHLLNTLVQEKALPIDRIERYVYVSRYKGSKERPFRMRSYFFHFADAEANTNVLDLWSASPLQLVTESEITTIKRKETTMAPYSNLKKLVEAVGGAHLGEFNDLIADALYGRQIRAIPYANGLYKVNAVESSPASPVARRNRNSVAPVPTASIKNKVLLEVQLDLLRGYAKGTRAFNAAKKRAVKTLNLGKKNERGVGGVIARTQGKFRPGFLKGLVGIGVWKDELANELVTLYKAKGVDVTAEELKREAENA